MNDIVYKGSGWMLRRDVLRGAGSGALVGMPGAISGIKLAAAAAHETHASPPAIEQGATSLDLGWRFHPGDISFTKILGHEDT